MRFNFSSFLLASKKSSFACTASLFLLKFIVRLTPRVSSVTTRLSLQSRAMRPRSLSTTWATAFCVRLSVRVRDAPAGRRGTVHINFQRVYFHLVPLFLGAEASHSLVHLDRHQNDARCASAGGNSSVHRARTALLTPVRHCRYLSRRRQDATPASDVTDALPRSEVAVVNFEILRSRFRNEDVVAQANALGEFRRLSHPQFARRHHTCSELEHSSYHVVLFAAYSSSRCRFSVPKSSFRLHSRLTSSVQPLPRL